jgi:hypothetical protein
MKNERGSKAIGPLQKVGVWCMLAFIAVASFAVSSMLMSRGQPPSQSHDEGSLSCFAILIVLLSVVAIVAGIVAYFIILATRCFTFSFEKQVWNSALRARLYISNIIVGATVLMGLSGMATALIGPILNKGLGLSREYALMIPFLVAFIPGQLLFAWLNLWKPLICGIIEKRLSAKGISQDEMATGIFAGVSDPDRSSMGKFSMVEDDFGMLWMTPDLIRYEGDDQAFEIRRAELKDIERVADQGSMAAYAGAVHIILHWDDEAGVAHKKRLHLENYWTLGALAHQFDDMAGRLDGWKAGVSRG